MRVEKGKDRYTHSSEIGLVESVAFDTGLMTMSGDLYRAVLVDRETIEDIKKAGNDFAGIPSIVHIGEKDVILHPKPDCDGNLIVNYWPPMKQM